MKTSKMDKLLKKALSVKVTTHHQFIDLINNKDSLNHLEVEMTWKAYCTQLLTFTNS